MNVNMRCKFRLESLETAEDGTSKAVWVPVTVGSPDNENFFKFTPYGRIEIGTINKTVTESLTVGCEYYVDFTRAM